MSKRPIYYAMLAITLAVPILPGLCHAQTVSRPTQKQDQAIRKFLVGYLGPPYLPLEKEQPTRYYAALVGLTDGAARDVIVYLTGKASCGLGGCTTLVLAPKGSSYRLVSRLPMTHPPIRVLAATSHGWHDLVVAMGGGGRPPEYEAKYSYNGMTYVFADKPPLRPLKGLGEKVLPGTDVVFGARGKRLYTESEMKAAGASPAKSSGSLPAVFIPILPEVKAKSRVPVLLPSELPYPIGRAKHAFVEKAAADGYGISLYYGQGGGDANFAAYFGAQAKPRYGSQDLGGAREVELSRGTRGFFRPVGCGVSCAPASLSWQKGDVVYYLNMMLSSALGRHAQEKAIVAAADSAILAGPR